MDRHGTISTPRLPHGSNVEPAGATSVIMRRDQQQQQQQQQQQRLNHSSVSTHHHHTYQHAAGDLCRSSPTTRHHSELYQSSSPAVATRSHSRADSVGSGTMYGPRKVQTPLPELPDGGLKAPKEVEMTRAMEEDYDQYCTLAKFRGQGEPLNYSDYHARQNTAAARSASTAAMRMHLRRNGSSSVTEVTRQARRVLERFLSYSSQKDYYSEMEGGLSSSRKMAGFYSDTGGGIGSHVGEGRTLLQSTISSGEQDDTESDYVDMMHLLAEASLASATTQRRYMPPMMTGIVGDMSGATATTTTTTASSSVASRSHSPKSDRVLFPIKPHHYRHHHHHHRESCQHVTLPEDDRSSSSTEDYEVYDNDLLTRKKKSFLRRAKERFRHTFRRFKDLAGGGDTDQETSPRDELGVQDVGISKKPKKKKSISASKLKLSFKRNIKDKSRLDGLPSEGVGGACIEVQNGRILATDTNMFFEPIEDAANEINSRSGKRSPVPWKNWEVRPRKKDLAEGREGLFESFFRQFRMSSFKSRSKSKAGRQRSCSADNLTIRSKFSKQEEQLLSQYARHPGGVALSSLRQQESDDESELGNSLLQGGSLNRSKHLGTASKGTTPLHRPIAQVKPNQALLLSAAPQVMRSYSTPTNDSNASRALNADTLHQSLAAGQPTACERPTRPRTPVEEVFVTRGTPERVRALPEKQKSQRPSGPAPRSTTPVEMVFVAPGDIKKRPPALLLRDDNVEDHDYVQIEGDETPGELYDKIGVKDVCDGNVRDAAKPNAALSTKLHHERTDKEKEEIYEKIAQQLAFIADSYNTDSLRSPKPSTATAAATTNPSEIDEAAGGGRGNRSSGSSLEGVQIFPMGPAAPLEKELAAMLREKGDSAGKPTTTELVEELVNSASYSKFKEVIAKDIGSQLGWQPIARMFRLTQVAVEFAGMGSAVAQQIQQNTLTYFEDRFANWIVDQGGWESVVEDDSELD